MDKVIKRNLREKSDYVTDRINSDSVDDLCYNYIYDITKYLVNRKAKGKHISNACYEDDLTQNIVINIYNIVIIEKRYNKIDSIFAFINQSVKFELMKAYRNKYIGKADFIEDISDEELSNEDKFYGDTYFNSENLSELELLINLERSLLNIIKLIYKNLNQSNINLNNRHLLVFPILLSYVKEDDRILKPFPNKVQIIAKEIINSLGSLRKFI